MWLIFFSLLSSTSRSFVSSSSSESYIARHKKSHLPSLRFLREWYLRRDQSKSLSATNRPFLLPLVKTPSSCGNILFILQCFHSYLAPDRQASRRNTNTLRDERIRLTNANDVYGWLDEISQTSRSPCPSDASPLHVLSITLVPRCVVFPERRLPGVDCTCRGIP